MCIIADPPLFVPIFKVSDPEHDVFAPVLKWVNSGPGKFVIGGSSYKKELAKVKSILPALLELERKGKVHRVPDAKVDPEERHVKSIEPCANFDDPHLVALVRATGCKLICLRDPRAHRYLRSSRFYASLNHRPKLYTRVKNSNLLCANNVAKCCE